jgi:anti-anti-sigma regulatory factor
MQVAIDGTARALTTAEQDWGEKEKKRKSMLSVHIENIGGMALIECEGRIVRSEAAFKLREAVNLQCDARVIVLDLSEVSAIEGGGLGMLAFLQRWAHDHDIRLKLFNPRLSVRDRLEQASPMREFDIVTLDEMMALLAHFGARYARAA